MKKLLLLFITLTLLSTLAFAQSEAPKLTDTKLFEIIGQLEVQVRLQGEYIAKLADENVKLKEENEKLKKSSTN